MKNFFVTICAATMLLTGCGQSDSPEAALNEISIALAERDAAKLSERVDLDDTWAALDKDTSGEPIALTNIPVKDIRYNFYRKILEWARQNNELIIGRSRGVLSDADGDLPINEVPINKIFIPPAD